MAKVSEFKAIPGCGIQCDVSGIESVLQNSIKAYNDSVSIFFFQIIFAWFLLDVQCTDHDCIEFHHLQQDYARFLSIAWKHRCTVKLTQINSH